MFLREGGGLEAFTREAFALYWQEGGAPEGLDADEDAPISSVAGRMGADPEEVLHGAATPGAKQDLKDATSEALTGKIRDEIRQADAESNRKLTDTLQTMATTID